MNKYLTVLLLWALACGAYGAAHGQVLWALPDSLIGRDFSLMVTVLETDAKPGEKFGYEGDRFGPMILRFVKDGDSIVLQQVTDFIPKTAKCSPEARNMDGAGGRHHGLDIGSLYAERHGYTDLLRFPILGKGNLIDIGSWLHDDRFFGLAPYAFLLRLGSAIADETKVTEIIPFKDRIIVRTELKYTPMLFPGVANVPSTWKIGTCLSLLDDEPMTSVYYDQRVGYFQIPAVRIDGERLIKTQVIKKFRNGPIRFGIRPGFPEKWIPAVIRSLENWNKVFSDAGLSSSIVVVDPEKFSLDDASVSWIKYNESHEENAYGRTFTDVRTGETICAHLAVFSGAERLLHKWYLSQTGDVGAFPEDVESALLEMVISHELGHILGLEHNYYGSRIHSVEQLQDAEYMRKHSLGSSIMDYIRMNYAALPDSYANACDLVAGIGPYDRAAITWAYSDGAFDRDAYAGMMYSTDSLRYLPQRGEDPRTLAEDVSNDPVAAARVGMSHLERACTAPAPADTVLLREAVQRQYATYIKHALSHLSPRYPEDLAGSKHQVASGHQSGYGHQAASDYQESSGMDSSAKNFLEKYLVNPPSWVPGYVIESLAPYKARYDTILDKVRQEAAQDRIRDSVERDEGNRTRPLLYRVQAQVDRGAGLRCRPIFYSDTLTSIKEISRDTSLLMRVFDEMPPEYGIVADMYEYPEIISAEQTASGYLLRLRYRFRKTVEANGLEMLPLQGSLPVEVSLALGLKQKTGAKTIVLVSPEVPESYMAALKSAARICNRENRGRIWLKRSDRIPAADAPAVISYDVCESGIGLNDKLGFWRMNIGAYAELSENELIEMFKTLWL